MPDLSHYEQCIDPETSAAYFAIKVRGQDLLKNPLLNKGTAFSREERETFDLRGLLPDHVATLDEQLERVRDQFDRKVSDMEKNIYLNGLMDRNETLFYRFLIEHLEDVVPIVYTPTVAYACRHWSRLFRRARGIYVTPRNRGRMAEVLAMRASSERPVIVVTDNERILGIGDQGAGGMGIPIGKLALYTAGAGIHPGRAVPISLDVGTNNPELLADPLYLGYRDNRLTGEAYESFIAEFVAAVQTVFPDALLQWEDFSNRTSFANLDTYRNVVPSFNDDIQGTAAMAVAGLLAATRHAGARIKEQRVVIVGAGSAGQGIRDQIAMAMTDDGATGTDARRQIFVLDSRGLIVEGRPDLTPSKARLAVPTAVVRDWQISDHPISLEDVVRNAKATTLIGVSGVSGVFTEDVVSRMARYTDRPVIMPLSNPTSHAEVTPASALTWTGGRAIVATGSPFAPVTLDGVTHQIGQANNMFIFPGMGLGVLAVAAGRVTDRMFLAAARALAATVPDDLLKTGQIYPDITAVRQVSTVVATAVAQQAVADGVAEPVEDLDAVLAAEMWFPEYAEYRPA